MEIKDMDLDEIATRRAEINVELDKPGADLDALDKEIRELNDREKELREAREERDNIERRIAQAKEDNKMMDRLGGRRDERAAQAAEFVRTGRMAMELRTLLSTGNLAKPNGLTATISELPETISSIVDDVTVENAEGTGAWTVPYRKTSGAAADVVEGQKIGGTEGTFDTVDINPATWGTLTEISNMVKKYTPVDYQGSVMRNAYLELRKKAKEKITAAIKASSLAEAVTVAIGPDYLRTLVLGYNADESVAGGTKLYLCKADLLKLGKVRGTNEKKPLYTITFTDENNGTISEGGMMVRFSINSSLGEGTQLYGQPRTVVMPMWGQYEVSTDEGGDYFARNVMAVRGLQTAGADLCAWHGMQVVSNE